MVNIINRVTNKGIITYIIQFLASSNLKIDDGSTDELFKFDDVLDSTGIGKNIVKELRKIPEINILFEERWLPAPFNLDELIQLPEGTLGHIYAHKIKFQGYNPYFYKTVPVVDDISYLKMLTRTTHDFYHLVGGFDTDQIGEAGLQAFFLAQTPMPLSAIIVSLVLLKVTFYQPNKLESFMVEIFRGYNLGSQTPSKFIAQKWDQYWDMQLCDVREKLGMKFV
ncbi:Coq4 family protein [Nodularia chucula]|uniref:Coq4 family protein n=1 Tax=Nodularia chucula TaxID=3093667 RepID=UPI0039C74DF0